MQIDVTFSQMNGDILVNIRQLDGDILANLNESQQEIETIFSAYQESSVEKEIDPYGGSYDVTPMVSAQTLPTAQKKMIQDMTIKGIPYFETSNSHNGKTEYIGSEIEVYGN